MHSGTFTLRRLFEGISEEDLRFLQEQVSLVRLPRGKSLLLGDQQSVYGVANGFLKLARESLEGQSLTFRLAFPGDWLGVYELFGEKSHTKFAIALKDAELFSLEADIFLSIVDRNAKFCARLLQAASLLVLRFEKRLEALGMRPARARIAALLCELAKIFGEDSEGFLQLGINRRDMAELADVTPETVSRILSELKSAKLIEIVSHKIRIIDKAALRLIEEEEI